MTLPDLLQWMWEGDGTWYVNGFLRAWAIIDRRRAEVKDGTAHSNGTTAPRRPDGHPVTPEPVRPPEGAPAWRGGPCDPICDFEDDGLLLIG
jgi:hypothetical protein